MSDKTEKLAVGLTEDEKRKVRVEAAKRDISMSELVREILIDEVMGDTGNLTMRTTTAD